MKSTDLLLDGFTRIDDEVREIASGLSKEQLEHRLDPDGNSLSWLLWHISRVQDAQVADIAGTEQVWITEGWAERLGLGLDPADTGYGYTSAQVAAVRGVSAEELVAYHESTFARTSEVIGSLDDDDLARVIDESYDPPVTVAVRLMSILADDFEHVGQAGYVRGLVLRR
ncbi:Protein of unknown function [Sanguibacter gelidistatuariae]|uniref:DinB-like domain-containing protein n=1 Tax=Sanguibacter gelidistatuariae TaxID=1814289 RepID=A0A1G6GWX1_9MICO|nr:DinB family protein [Sanguibacter gelidistatuariae]SDB86527.1 Protein of unknown function [Sanguibacter gelidistatuariae]